VPAREKKKIGCSQGSNFSILEHEIATACATVHSATHFLSVKQFYVSVAINYLADGFAMQTHMFNLTKIVTKKILRTTISLIETS